MKSHSIALACAGILILPVQCVAASLSDSRVSIVADRVSAVSATGKTQPLAVSAGSDTTRSGSVSPRESNHRAHISSQNSELKAAVEAQDQLLERKLKSICRGC
jgi:hypothetical protein